jgi:hypothetical protein
LYRSKKDRAWVAGDAGVAFASALTEVGESPVVAAGAGIAATLGFGGINGGAGSAAVLSTSPGTAASLSFAHAA